MIKKEKKQKFEMVIVTGMSGAGKTEVVRTLEDMNFFCVDNLPPALMPKFVELCNQSSGNVKKVAFVADIRGGRFFHNMLQILDEMNKDGCLYKIIYLEASDETLIRRYKETRRKHPLVSEGRVSEGILKERNLLEPIRGRATVIFDTSNFKPLQLKEKILNLFSSEKKDFQMLVNVCSFGFKHGVLKDADMLFDVRFLPNPFYIDNLRKKSGEHKEVAAYIEKWPVTDQFLKKLLPLIDFLMPHYEQEGKSNLTIAVGCTGGMHRSVFIVRKIYDFLLEKNIQVSLEHRDLKKNEHEKNLVVLEKAQKIYD